MNSDGENSAPHQEPSLAALSPAGLRWLAVAGKIAGAAFLAFAVLVVCADIFQLLAHHTRYPFGDQWWWLGVFYNEGILEVLVQQFNEHRIPVPGLLFILDQRIFGGAQLSMTIEFILIELGCAALLALPLWRHREVAQPVRWIFAGAAGIAMLWFIQGESFYYPYTLAMSLAHLQILAALYLFARLHTAQGAGRPALRMWAGIVACGVGATYSYGSGMLVWPALLATGLLCRAPKRSLAILGAAFVCAAGLYFIHYSTPPAQVGPLQTLRSPLRVIHYSVIMLGLPLFGAGAQDISVLHRIGCYAATLGAIAAALGMLLHLAVARTAVRVQAQVFYCAVILFTLGTALVTGLARSHFPLEQALSGRYSPVPLLFWFATAGLATVYISAWERNGGVGRVLWCAGLMVAAATTVSTQAPMARYFAIRERNQAAAAVSIAAGVPDAPRIAEEMAALGLVSYVDQMVVRSRGRSLFAHPETVWAGSPLSKHFTLAPADACTGYLDSATVLPAPAVDGVRLRGWVWGAKSRRPAERIWIADGAQVIRGFGITQVLRPDVAAALRNPALESAGWVAYARGTPAGELTAFADFGEGKTVCQVGTPLKPAP
jgi:hypothetical protein